MSYFPTAEQVTVAWLSTLPLLPTNGVATSLPADNSSWAASGFVVVTSVGGSPAVDTPIYSPVMQVDCWAGNVNSAKPPWGKAGQLAGAIEWATYGPSVQQVLDLPAAFYNARLLSVVATTEPRRIPSDEAGFARVQMDLTVNWVVDGGVVT